MDDSIKAGRAGEARDFLERFVRTGVPRAYRAEAASVAVRVGAPHLGVRLLHGDVRPATGRAPAATPAEQAAYAHCLARIGATDEALALLAGVDVEAVPDALFYRASTLIGRWDYEAALPLLERYAGLRAVAPYRRLVARLNQAAALLFLDRTEEATPFLRRLLHDARVRKLTLVEGNALELSAQSFLLQRDFDRAHRCLDRAEALLARTGTADAFFVRKWRYLVDYVRRPGDGLATLRAEAAQREDWETLRDADRFAALGGDPAALARVWFGTPFPSYRAAIARDLGSPPSMPSTFRWAPGGTEGPVLDLVSGGTGDAGAHLKRGQLLHRLLLALAGDFYRPQRVASLAMRLFVGEHFNPDSTPPRVHEAIRRLRLWLGECRLPLVIVESGGAFRLAATAPATVVVPDAVPSESAAFPPLERLRARWPAEPFTTREAATFLGLPMRTMQRLLEGAVAAGAVARQGGGRGVRYRFAPLSRVA